MLNSSFKEVIGDAKIGVKTGVEAQESRVAGSTALEEGAGATLGNDSLPELFHCKRDAASELGKFTLLAKEDYICISD